MDEITELLVAVLARTDALWAPLRLTPHSRSVAAAVEERRAAFRRAGLPVAGGGTRAARKSYSRQIEAARATNYIQTRGRTRLSARLTTEADDVLRTMTAGYRIDQVRPLLELVQVLADCGQHNCGAVCEVDLIGTNYSRVTSSQIGQLEQMAAPLLARGLLRSYSDGERRVGYEITDTGRRALAAHWPQPPEDLPEYCAEAAAEYDACLAAALAERDSWRPESSLVVIPLGAGSWPASLEDLR